LQQSKSRPVARPRRIATNGKPGIPACGVALVVSDDVNDEIGSTVVIVEMNSNTVVVT
jgi:hypothetical protein